MSTPAADNPPATPKSKDDENTPGGAGGASDSTSPLDVEDKGKEKSAVETPKDKESTPIQPNDIEGETLEKLWAAVAARNVLNISNALVRCHLLFHDAGR